MGHKPFKKSKRYNIFVLPKTEEEIEDRKHIYYIQGKPILALNENIANEIYMRNYKEPKDEMFGEDQSKTFIIRIGNFRFRFLYDPCILIDGWVNISFHFSYTLKHTLNFHMAVRKKWPFIKIGVKNIYPKLYRGEF